MSGRRFATVAVGLALLLMPQPIAFAGGGPKPEPRHSPEAVAETKAAATSYWLRNKKRDNYCAASYQPTDDIWVMGWDCIAGNQPNNQWTFTQISYINGSFVLEGGHRWWKPKTYTIHSVHKGGCLHAYKGQKVFVAPCDGSKWERWVALPRSDGTYTYVNYGNSLTPAPWWCLDEKHGTYRVDVGVCRNDDNGQRWFEVRH